MLVFPNCKINLGLHVVEKRPDAFHNIETAFYPLNWCDALEIIPGSTSQKFELEQSGRLINGELESNLIYKAWKLIEAQRELPSIKVHLHKTIPMGAGLGGGSADAAFFISQLDQQFNLLFTEKEKLDLASELGSDCAFFIKNTPLLATGKGNQFSDLHIDLSDYFIAAVYPQIHSDTKEAYSGLVPKQPAHQLRNILENEPLENWKDLLVNDFEESIFKKYPQIRSLKEQLYSLGAIYASMSGSGSAVYGIFKSEPVLELAKEYSYCLQKPKSKIL